MVSESTLCCVKRKKKAETKAGMCDTVNKSEEKVTTNQINEDAEIDHNKKCDNIEEMISDTKVPLTNCEFKEPDSNKKNDENGLMQRKSWYDSSVIAFADVSMDNLDNI